MFGIVLWSDPKRQKAIVWCEDCAKLAYASASDIMIDDSETLSIGDLVQFTLVTFGDFRGCTNLTLLDSKIAPNISEHLLRAASNTQPNLRVVNG
ncbi:hypothetical protein SAMN04488032_107153 [Pacificibacter marinus]|jgi:hypothetical protein|uniref:Uncharacterized protein n=1 Tax=Pacificibacter marinus TaxID=658057 RepID=A0A1Y5T1L1_9RHOB|nr:hypothetical protein SAMN04488032_107153 [Pacificibacter marinus]SLN50107.1 hypothetical protein PAM7971_02474 [Pacificibacter marinus]